MGVRDAAIKVLKEADGPLHAREITKRILSRGLWKTNGKTPAATVSARLYSDIKKNGDDSPFILTGPQTFGLKETGATPKPTGKSQAIQAKSPTAATSAVNTYSFTEQRGLDCRTHSHANSTDWSLLDEEGRRRRLDNYDPAISPFKLPGERVVS